MSLNIKRLGPNGIQIEAVNASTIDTKGELEVIDSSGALQYHDGTAVRKVLLDTFSGNITITGDLSVTGQATVDNLNLNGNTLSSTNVDGGIIIDPNGNGNIDLTVSGTGVVNLGSASITIDASGNMSITGSLTVDNVSVNGNTISIVDTNGNLNLNANGTGLVRIGSTSVTVDNSGNVDITGSLSVDNIDINGNTISSTDVDGDITLLPNGTGDVIVDSLSVSLPVKTGAAKELISGAIDLASAEVTGTLPVANGGTGSATQNFVDLTTNQSIEGDKSFLDNVVAQKEFKFKLNTSNSSTGNQAAVVTADNVIIRFTNDTGPTIQGLADGSEARVLIISYVGSGTMTVSNENASASAADRILTGSGNDIVLDPNASLWLYYDSTSQRWRVIGGTGGGLKIHNQDDLTLTASDTITLDTISLIQNYRVQGNSAAITLSSTPFGAGPFEDGLQVTLLGNSSTNSVTLVNNDAATGCLLNGDIELCDGDSISLVYNLAKDRFIEKGRK